MCHAWHQAWGKITIVSAPETWNREDIYQRIPVQCTLWTNAVQEKCRWPWESMSENWLTWECCQLYQRRKELRGERKGAVERGLEGTARPCGEALNWGMAAGGAWLDMHVLLWEPKNVQERGGLPLLYPRVDWTGGLWVRVVGAVSAYRRRMEDFRSCLAFCQVSNSSQWLLTPNAVVFYWRAWNMFPGPNRPAVFSRCALFQLAHTFLENCGEFTFL